MVKQRASYLVQVAGATPANGEDKPASGPVYRCGPEKEVFVRVAGAGLSLAVPAQFHCA